MTDPIPLKTDKAAGSPTAALQCRNMFAIASGKGGVGKTWFAVTLCHALAKKDKRVLLFDGDFGLANVDTQLGITPEKDLGSVVEGQAALADVVMRYEAGGFDILPGRSGSANMASLPAQKLSDLRQDLINLADRYDYVMVDLGAGIDRSVRQMAGPAAATYVVITEDPTSIRDGYAFLKLARAANPQADLRIVVNMAASASEGQKTYDVIRNVAEHFLHYVPPLAGTIRRDTKVREAIRAQTPLLVRSPTSEAAMDIEAIVLRHLQ